MSQKKIRYLWYNYCYISYKCVTVGINSTIDVVIIHLAIHFGIIFNKTVDFFHEQIS